MHLADDTVKTLKIDRVLPVSAVVREIADKLRLGTFGHRYWLRAGPSKIGKKAAESAQKSDIAGSTVWLRGDQTLDEQGCWSSELYFAKRYFDLSINDGDESNATDEHLTFFAARNELIQGKYDGVASSSAVAELAAILLLQRFGTKPKNVLLDLQDNLFVLVPQRLAKKGKSSFLAKIVSNFESFVEQPWAADPRAVKRRFMQTIIRLPFFGTVPFAVESARCGDAEFSNVSLLLSSQSLQLVPSKSPRLDKTHEAVYSASMTRISRKSVAGTTLCLSCLEPSGQTILLTFVSDSAMVIDEYVSVFLSSRSAAAKGSPDKSPKIDSAPSHGSGYSLDTSTLESAVTSCLQAFDGMEQSLRALIISENQQDQDDESAAGMSIGQWYSQAATHLASVARLAVLLAKQIRTATTDPADSAQPLIGSVAMYCHTVLSVGRCIVRSTDRHASSQQTVCGITRSLLLMSSQLVSQAWSAGSVHPAALDAELTAATRVLPLACGILDVALRARLTDEASAASMLLCCRDIEASTSELVSQAENLLATDLATSATPELLAAVTKSKILFWWHSHCFRIGSGVVLRKDEAELWQSLTGCLDSVSVTASSLLSSILESFTESPRAPTEVVMRLKWSWGCLDQSLNLYTAVASSCDSPMSDIDPMLPTVLFLLTSAVDSLFSSFPSSSVLAKGSTPAIDSVTALAGAVVRTLARQSSIEFSSSVQLSGKITTAAEKMKSSFWPESFKSGTLKRKQSRVGTISKRSGAAAVLGVLDAAMAVVCEPRAVSAEKSLKRDLRLVHLNVISLRSTLRAAGSAGKDLAKYVDATYVREALEQFDVLAHTLVQAVVPFLSGKAAAPLASVESAKHLLSEIFSREDSDTLKFGFFSATIRTQLQRLSASLEVSSLVSPSSAFAPPAQQSSTSLSPEMPVRRGGWRASLLVRPNSVSPKSSSPAGSLSALAEALSGTEAVVQRTSEGMLESVNESALLHGLGTAMSTGQTGSFGIRAEELLDICLTTFPYWTSVESVTATIVAPVVSPDGATSKQNAMVGTRVSMALAKLLRLHPSVLQDPGARIAVNSAVAVFKSSGSELQPALIAVEDTIRDSLDALSRSEKIAIECRAVGDSVQSGQLDLLSVDLSALANQMTLIEQRFFDSISIPDFIGSAWTKKSNALTAWVAHSNAISRWIASRILQLPKKRSRARAIGRIMKLADLLRDMNNFSSQLTIFLALSMDCIARLKKTWEFKDQSLVGQFGKLSEEIKLLQNFAGYRELLKKASSACVPYAAVLMRDLVMLEEVQSQAVSGSTSSGAIFTFAHLETIAKVIQSQFVRFRKARYHLEHDPVIYSELLSPDSFNIFDENQLLAEAQKLEPDKSRGTKSANSVPPIPLTMKRSGSGSALPESGRPAGEYGVRSIISPRATSDRAESSRTFSPSMVWRRQAALCASACESASTSLSDSGKLRIAQFAISLADLMSTALKTGSPRSARDSPDHTRQSLPGGEEDSVSVAHFVRNTSTLLSALTEINCNWETTQAADSYKSFNLSNSLSLQVVAVAIQAVKSATSLLPESIRYTARIAADVQQTADKTGWAFTVSFVMQIPKGTVDASSIETTITSLFIPSSLRHFNAYKGRVLLGLSGAYHCTLTVSMTVPVYQAK